MDEKIKLGAEDQRKLHAEINQILNQRFLLTTAAITTFGAFSAFMIPKDPNHINLVVGQIIFGGTSYLLLFLLLLFLWNRFLSNLQTIISSYLLVQEASMWEEDWKAYYSKNSLSTGKVQTIVFFALGVLSTAWPFLISIALGIPMNSEWAGFVIFISLIYMVLVYGFGIKKWLLSEKKIEDRWRRVLSIAPDENPSSDL